MRYIIYLVITILTITLGCNRFDPFVVTEKPFVNQTSVQLYFGEHAGDRNTFQLASSSSRKSHVWSSQDPTVVTVDQTGLLKAVSEGITTVTLSSENDKVTVDVNVKEYIPLESFTLSTNEVVSFWHTTTPIFVTYYPDNATDVNLEWTSTDRSVAEVYSNGLIKTLLEGTATITAKYGDIEQSVGVWVLATPKKMDKSGWRIPGYNPNSDDGTIGYSSQQRSDGGGVPSIIDDDLATYWHARWSSPASKYPHWFIIDLGEEVSVAKVSMARRKGDKRGQKGYQVFTCAEAGATNLSDPTTWAWEDQGEYVFDSTKDGHQKVPMPIIERKYIVARYIKVFIDTKFKGENDYAMVADFSVYVSQ